MLLKLTKFYYQNVFTSQVIMCFVFDVWSFDDVMTFEYLKRYNFIISRTKRAFEVK